MWCHGSVSTTTWLRNSRHLSDQPLQAIVFIQRHVHQPPHGREGFSVVCTRCQPSNFKNLVVGSLPRLYCQGQ